MKLSQSKQIIPALWKTEEEKDSNILMGKVETETGTPFSELWLVGMKNWQQKYKNHVLCVMFMNHQLRYKKKFSSNDWKDAFLRVNEIWNCLQLKLNLKNRFKVQHKRCTFTIVGPQAMSSWTGTVERLMSKITALIIQTFMHQNKFCKWSVNQNIVFTLRQKIRQMDRYPFINFPWTKTSKTLRKAIKSEGGRRGV